MALLALTDVLVYISEIELFDRFFAVSYQLQSWPFVYFGCCSTRFFAERRMGDLLR
jgi:hypothetical protein